MYWLRLLGGLGLLEGAEPLAGRAVQRRRLAVLALLGTAPTGSLSRDKLVGYLWPEHAPEQARRLLTVSVYELRKALGEDAIQAAGNELRLNPKRVRTDAAEFEQACRAADWARATELYVGPFADGFYVADAPEFEDWVERQRERYVRMYQRALETLAAERAAARDPQGALDAWRRLAATDAFNTRYALALMHALDAAGDRAGAVRQAKLHAKFLREELGAEPAAEVESLAAQLQRYAPRGAVMETPTPRAANASSGESSHQEPELPASSTLESSLVLPRPAVAKMPLRGISRRSATILTVAVLLLASSAYVSRLDLGGKASRAEARGGSAFPERSIAVLPFENMSNDRQNDYFSDGITEDIITRLTQVPELKVISRASVMQYRATAKPVRVIAHELGVGTLLKGSVRRAGDRIRITVQLIDAGNERHLWAESFDHDVADVFATQSEIARHVAHVLQIHLSTGEGGLPIPGGTADLTAYDYFLQARRFHYYADAPEDNEAAIRLFRQAIQVDTGFALAYAGLGNTYAARQEYMPGAWLDSAQVFVARALSLDRRVDYAYDALGTIHRDRGRLRLALETYRSALALNPGNANVLSRTAGVYGLLGRPDSALVHAKRSVSLDPATATRYRQVAAAYGALDDLLQAEQWHRKALQVRPDFVLSRRDLFYLYRGHGAVDKAAAELTVARSLNGQHPAVQIAWGDLALLDGDYSTAAQEFSAVNERAPNDLSWSPGVRLAYAQLKLGNLAEAREEWQRAEARLRQLSREGHEHPSVRYELARLAAMQNRTDEAYAWLDDAIRRGFIHWRWMRIDPLLENLHGEPRFEGMLSALADKVEALRGAAH